MGRIKSLAYNILGGNNKNKIDYLLSFRYYKYFKNYKNKKKILYALVPTHGNLGDQAIVYASLRYIDDNLPEYEVIQINFNDTYKYGKALEKIMKKDDLIFLPGGGNMGNHYLWEEEARRHIIEKFKKIQIVSFPQTIFFSNDENGKKEFNKTKHIYNSHKNLSLLAREDKSFAIMKENFPNCNVVKSPDIVFYLNNKLKNNSYERKKIMICFRKDKETYVSMDKKAILIDQLIKNYEDVLVSDTIINKTVSKEEREGKLLELWKAFYESKVVITDRLHGMIFCAITKTPCIVTRSLDHKVVESYSWIANLNYIRFIDELNFNEIKYNIDYLLSIDELNNFDFDTSHFNKLLQQCKLI
ncbi:polysaccharide pyruvyl transferase family protein [Clostridium grantii]|uniref:Exopolysaccharide biosynthesis protein EpsI, predicted pyruvyl transferase n=1 Tax=Clostridium grantii DSM 8605 TaxID=1121316 RepID=A0A1M5UZP5_9CLOT|nr:polysaccharide pyruvyl transferase family protein [Clostridium grantii]SHH68461.1 Exopolysaccharide biosynthesis protein EpsI, predicted pyruvyl transferase [Clostridium grantii DSM 8605]